MEEPKRRYGKAEDYITAVVVTNEFETAKSNYELERLEFEKIIDILECKRNEKDYEWMSDNFLPEFPSIVLTDASDWANQYFSTRTFVEVKLDNYNIDDKKKCEAAKRLINQTLNNKGIYYYHKYIRARHINALYGNVYALCWWETKRNNRLLGYETKQVPTGKDTNGFDFINPAIQEQAFDEYQEPVIDASVVYDRFNFEVLDPRNVFTDNKYAYSVQDKDWVTIRSEKSIWELEAEREKNNYFNLDVLKSFNVQSSETETSQETYNRDDMKQHLDKTPIQYFDILERYGWFLAIVKETDQHGNPVTIEPPYDETGNTKKNAVPVMCIITHAVKDNRKALIRFQPMPFLDYAGRPYMPLIRGWCYIHPTKDTGLSDGKYSREIQVAINDTFNMSNDRVKLATLPTLKGKKYSLTDNDTIYFEPEHVMELEDVNDLVEFKITDDVGGAINQIAMLKAYMQQVTAKFPTTMGQLPEQSSTTATAVNETSLRTNTRNNYKSLTFEYTFLVEMYWMILQMAYQYMQPETAEMVLGDFVQHFDPAGDYTYSPVTSSIELEQNRFRKLQIIDQMVGRMAGIPNPNTPKVLNYLLKKAFEMFQDEFPDYEAALLDETAPVQPPGTLPNQMTDMASMPTSNQSGVAMGNAEMMTRSGQSGGMIG